jgi:SAM-dependent methyltransferase
MREHIKRFVRVVAESLPLAEPIYEFGALQVPGQEGFADLRPLFPGRTYLGCDLVRGPGVDLVLDLHAIDLPRDTAGTVLLMDTLEHVEFLRQAIAECYRVLKPNGTLVMSSVMNFVIHDYPSDYWRFTPEGFRSLLRPFQTSYVDSAGPQSFPHTVVGVGIRGSVPQAHLDALVRRAAEWQTP